MGIIYLTWTIFRKALAILGGKAIRASGGRIVAVGAPPREPHQHQSPDWGDGT